MSKSIYYFILIILAVITFCIQSKMFLCGDVAYLLHVTKLLVSGGTYARDFFETNPPMILALYSPVIVINQLTHWDVITVVRVYILTLAVFSISLSVFLMDRIFSQKARVVKTALFAAIAFTLLFLPAGEFGQREHVFMILFIPYVLLAMLSVENKSVSVTLAALIGVMAGLGIGMKPFFLAPMVLIEGYLMVSARSLRKCLRIELITCALVLVVYLILVYFAEPTYVYVILPLVSHLYFISSRETWTVIFSHLSVIFCLLVVAYYGLYLLSSKDNSTQTVERILFLALIGMIAAFLMPRSAWYYHLIPAMGFGLMLLAVCLSQGKTKQLIVLGVWVLMMPVYAVYHYSTQLFQAKRVGDRASVIAYIQSRPDIQSVYCFSASYTQDCFPLVNLTKTTYGGRSPFFWWVTGLVTLEKNNLSPVVLQDKNYLIDAIADDLTSHKTNLVIINVADMKNKLGAQFDYITYFSRNEKFKAAWKPYHYVKAIGDYQLFQREA